MTLTAPPDDAKPALRTCYCKIVACLVIIYVSTKDIARKHNRDGLLVLVVVCCA